MLEFVLRENQESPSSLRVLDFGAGNGMAGEALRNLGILRIVGIDILQEAKAAAERDRIWVYDEYLVEDLTEPSSNCFEIVRSMGINTLVTVAALGFGDIPVHAFYKAYNMIDAPGWVALNIREDFLKSSETKGFGGLINKMFQNDIMQCEMYKRYRHRINTSGESLFYVAMVCKKLQPIDESFLVGL